MWRFFKNLWSRWFPRRRTALTIQELGAVVAAMQHAVAQSHRFVADQFREYLAQYFHETDGRYEARTEKVVAPDGSCCQIPLFALQGPSAVSLKEMEVSLRVEAADEAILRETIARHCDSPQSIAVTVKPSGTSPAMDVRLKVSAGRVPEGVQRAIDAACVELCEAIRTPQAER